MKDHIRDYATAAFRFYAKVGLTADEYKRKIYNEALEEQKRLEAKCGISSPTEVAIIRAEAAVNQKIAEIRGMEAVDLTLSELKGNSYFNENSIGCCRIERREIIRAIEIVYFTDPFNELKAGDIQDRVHKAEIDIPASERAIYKWLRIARNMFSQKRGLRVENNLIKSVQ